MNTSCWSLSKYPAAFYRLLGIILNNYGGSFNPIENCVQQYSRCFYTYDYIDWTIDQLHKTISCFLSEINLPDDLRIEETIKEENEDKRHSSSFIKLFSENACSYMKSVDFENVSDLFTPCFGVSNDLRHLAQLQRLEFICGAYIDAYRGTNARWVFCNNFSKFQLIYKYMVDLADEDDIITTRTVFTTPNTHKIDLNTDGSLWKNIKNKLDQN